MTPELQELKTRLDRAERRARLSWACALGALALTMLLNVRPAVLAQNPGVSLASLQAAIAALQSSVTALQQKTAALTQTGTPGSSGATLQVTGVNVQIIDGLGSTSAVNGLGNLILGYNESGPGFARTGSHNLIVGAQNQYTSYGGLVAGNGNGITAPYASVTGESNLASGRGASISGGFLNTASGSDSAVSGGTRNTAGGSGSSVSGGAANTAGGSESSVSGGGSFDVNTGQVVGVTENNPFGWAAGGTGSGTFHSP